MKGVVENKPSHYPEGNQSKNSTVNNKGQESKPKSYIGKKTRTKTQGTELKSNNDFKGWCSDLEDYIFDVGSRASEKLARTMKELERYLGAIYSNICHPDIMTNTPSTFPNPEIPTIIPGMDV